ncbi:iron ABC transporter permease [Halovulum dunhuangense]|uniref:Iron ABC transporter permease n=1 Tax=Halovulum dunhuangense TaxID=1505036 RepID=A0A849L514_9RHOB|nr:lipocalin-like domain-containing protein [Halovulum dunhuangense]NNU81449.1 iron ABC transporter permease [Halovulum dunhuangense]
MHASLTAILMWLLLAPVAAAQGYAGLGSAAEDYAQVTPGRSFAFPADHGPHPDYRIEWWYLTANLEAADGTPMGLQWTLFRQAMRPDAGLGEGWAAEQVWMGHAAVTTPGDHHLSEIFARGGIGQAGVTATPFEAWIDDWRMLGTAPQTADPFDALHLTARGDDFSYDLRLTATGPVVLQGERGFSVKSDAGQASYYYSQPFYTAEGTVTLDGREIAVTGRGWLDREWSSQPLTSGQTGWDWFSLHLPGGDKLMAYRLRNADGTAYAPGTFIAADGTPTPLPDGALVMEPLGTETVLGREIPVRWRVALPSRGIDLVTEPVNAQSYMTTAFPYWEGPIRYSGTHQGVGYLEMTGY